MGQPKKRGLVTEFVSRAEARRRGLKRYLTGKPCRNGHLAERLVSNSVCLDCQLATNRRGAEADPARFRRYSREGVARFAASRPDRFREIQKAQRLKQRAYQAAWTAANRERVRAAKRRWKAKSPDWARGWSRKRRQQLAMATPAWLSMDQIEAIDAVYIEARLRGPGWEVDHIIPLNGKTVCGLHVPWNLQILTAKENRQKGNRLSAQP